MSIWPIDGCLTDWHHHHHPEASPQARQKSKNKKGRSPKYRNEFKLWLFPGAKSNMYSIYHLLLYGLIISLFSLDTVCVGYVDTLDETSCHNWEALLALYRNNQGDRWYLLWHTGVICFCQKAAQHPANVLLGCCYQLLPQGTNPSKYSHFEVSAMVRTLSPTVQPPPHTSHHITHLLESCTQSATRFLFVKLVEYCLFMDTYMGAYMRRVYFFVFMTV